MTPLLALLAVSLLLCEGFRPPLRSGAAIPLSRMSSAGYRLAALMMSNDTGTSGTTDSAGVFSPGVAPVSPAAAAGVRYFVGRKSADESRAQL
jgi:hypothetical protein